MAGGCQLEDIVARHSPHKLTFTRLVLAHANKARSVRGRPIIESHTIPSEWIYIYISFDVGLPSHAKMHCAKIFNSMENFLSRLAKDQWTWAQYAHYVTSHTYAMHLSCPMLMWAEQASGALWFSSYAMFLCVCEDFVGDAYTYMFHVCTLKGRRITFDRK